MTSGAISDDRDLNFGQIFDLALRFDVKQPDGFDFVSEELDPNGLGRIGRKNIDNPPVDAEFPGKFDRGDAFKSMFDQPAGQVLQIQIMTGTNRSRDNGSRLTAENGLEKCVNCRDNDPRG